MAEAPERIFNNRYRLDAKLGEGGMATVFGATDVLLRRRVAVKVLREQYAADREFVRRFYQEAESAAKLSHPNIVNTYDVGHEGDAYYIVMELVDGPSLAEIIAGDGKLPEAVAIDYAAQIASGLAYAHRSGLMHRDIKPANILITKDDIVKLSDFGIARAVSEHTMALTKPGLVMGSVYYISPEQAQGHEVHEASDLYSLGIVLYQMLTGRLPYTGESPVTVALKHLNDPVPRLDSREFGVSPALASIVNKLLQKQPAHRFNSASELASALREARERPSVAGFRFADDAPARGDAPEPGPPSRRLPPRRSPMPDRHGADDFDDEPRRSPSLGAVALLIVFLGLATVAGFLLFGRPLPSLSAGVTVGNYLKMTDAQAYAAIVNDGLRERVTRSSSDTVPANHVINQNPPPGTTVEKNSLVEIVVSNGQPTIGLPSVVGYTYVDAERTLQSLPNGNVVVTIARRYDDAPKDSVIAQQPVAGTQIRRGSRVRLTVSNGPAPVTVPNFVGLTTTAAQAEASRLGIDVDTSSRVAGLPADTVASQDVAAGTKVDKNVLIHLVINSGTVAAVAPVAGGASVTIPDVTGESYARAMQALIATGFTVTLRYAVQSTNNGTIVAQQPATGSAAPGAPVAITLSVSGEVPDTGGMSVAGAERELAAYGYAVAKTEYTTKVGADGKVVGTDPLVGTNLSPGSTVNLIVNGTGP